jgi:hypothetical protein
MEENIDNKEEIKNNEDCSCCSQDEMQMEEVVSGNAFVLNSLIDLLIDKKIISEEEFTKKLEESQHKLADVNDIEEDNSEDESNDDLNKDVLDSEEKSE